jgi:anhydro-N-acetylmuramic acid kinase
MKPEEDKVYKVSGIMSGTSLDGMDLAACNFILRNGKWEFSIEHAITYAYTPAWKTRLQKLIYAEAKEIALAHFDFGKLCGEFAKRFHTETGFDPLFIASHGHTVFHNPEKGYTLQIGNGASIATTSGKPVVCDFRATDISLGGQGAPLVPIGDQILFHQYDACLNLGGFSNISLSRNGKRIAFDICPVNTVLNKLAAELGKGFDNKGDIARHGEIIPSLLEALNNLPFYAKSPPKSLGAEWLELYVYPVISGDQYPVKDKLRTFTEHIISQITKVISEYEITNMLVTGGGTHNIFLLENLRKSTNCDIIVPDAKTIEFKEALVFALLGLLRWFEQPNCLASATGASHDSIGGAVYLPVK